MTKIVLSFGILMLVFSWAAAWHEVHELRLENRFIQATSCPRPIPKYTPAVDCPRSGFIKKEFCADLIDGIINPPL